MCEKEKAEIIPFHPTCSYYLELGMDAFQQYQNKKALKYLKRAYSLAKQEEEKVFAGCQLAICLQHMDFFKESTELLEGLQKESQTRHPEIAYFLANNYAFLDEMEKAMVAVEYYLDSEDQSFRNEAEELLALILLEYDGDE